MTNACSYAELEELVHDKRICADTYLVYVLADCATLVSNVLSDVIFRTHRGTNDAEAIDLDYIGRSVSGLPDMSASMQSRMRSCACSI